jgi:small-conductance mechanosensitive channel
MRRLEIEVTVGYGSDVPKALLIFNQILSGDASILKNPRHSITFKKYGDSGVTFVLKFWIQRPCNILKLRTSIAAQIAQTFDEENIMSPYTKDVQTGEEAQLSKIPEKRKSRITSFYSQPAFAVTAAPAPEANPEQGLPAEGQPPEGQATGEAIIMPPDFEEPEA